MNQEDYAIIQGLGTPYVQVTVIINQVSWGMCDGKSTMAMFVGCVVL